MREGYVGKPKATDQVLGERERFVAGTSTEEKFAAGLNPERALSDQPDFKRNRTAL